MAYCKQCGAQLLEGSRFCTNCGSEELVAEAQPVVKNDGPAPQMDPQPAYQQPSYTQPSYAGSERREPAASGQDTSNAGGYQSAYQQAPSGQSAYGQQSYNRQPAYTPQPSPVLQNTVMSTGAFLGTLLLMMIPIAGFILMLVWAFGGTDNPNRRNLARAMLIIVAISIVLTILLSVLIGALAVSSYRLWDSDFQSDFEEGFREGFEERFDGFDGFSYESSEEFFNQSFRGVSGAFALL